jgi:hypothetical protein
MTTPDLEHVLADTLHRHAEEAMINTDTRTQHERFEERLAEEAPRRRRHAIGGALVAAAAVTAAAVWAADLDGSGSDSDPVGPSVERTEAERVADEFFAAVAAGDEDLAASYVAPGTVPWDEYQSEMRRDAAWDVKYLLEPCQELSTSPAGTNVVCAFDYYSLGSDELGLEPFEKNTLTLRISDGQVVHSEPTYNSGSNGEDELFASIGAWIRDNHPGEWRFLANTEGYTQAELNRWYRLWERRVDEYVAEQLKGE